MEGLWSQPISGGHLTKTGLLKQENFLEDIKDLQKFLELERDMGKEHSFAQSKKSLRQALTSDNVPILGWRRLITMSILLTQPCCHWSWSKVSNNVLDPLVRLAFVRGDVRRRM